MLVDAGEERGGRDGVDRRSVVRGVSRACSPGFERDSAIE
jgi:hypothetical protein